MSALSRLSTVLTEGQLDVAGKTVCVIRPPAGYDISSLPRDGVTVHHTFKPDVAAWEAGGYRVSADVSNCDVAIVVVPRAKALARSLIASACAKAKIVVVDGAKTDGIDSLFKACRKVLGDLPTLTKDHGRIFWFHTTDAFAAWAAPAPSRDAHGYITTAGVFSDGAIDKGSAFLVEVLPPKLPARIADLGAGWGFLAHHILTREGVAHLDLIEAEALALDCARQNVSDPRARFLWADATTFAPPTPYDGIVMNPPFHTARAADPALGRTFIRAAAAMLTPNGKLWMVANRHLPYEHALSEAFRTVDMIAQNNAFKVFHAIRPKR